MINFTAINTTSISATINPLLLNISCESPHNEQAKIYTYILDDTFIGICTFVAVVNFITILPTSILNLLIILGFTQQKNIRTTSNRLLFSICAADFITGILVQPIFGAHIIEVTKGSHKCDLVNFLIYTVPVLIVITMVTHMVIALERYVSIHYRNTYLKVFTKRYITWFIVLIWIACLSCFILPFITGDPILGTKIIVAFILLSLAVCSFCYISMYQDFKWKDGKPKTNIEGAFVIHKIKPTERTGTEQEQYIGNLKLSAFFFKLFVCMAVLYILNLIKNALNSYDVFKNNGHFVVHYVFDTLLFLNALINPILILRYDSDIANAVKLIYSR